MPEAGSPARPPIVLDVDTGIDDALAIALALRSDTNLVGISTVSGNVSIEAATRNTRGVLAWLGAGEVPVYRGASRALVAEHRRATNVHGENGLGGAVVDAPDDSVGGPSGVDALLQAANRYPGELVVVALGPLTNIAMALNIAPWFARQVRTLVVMGGAFSVPGNVTEFAEFNIHVDPHACQQVLRAPWNEVMMVGLDVTHRTAMSRLQWEGIPHDAGGAPGLVRAITEHSLSRREDARFHLHDPLALAVALQPDLIEVSAQEVSVHVDGSKRGRTMATGHGPVKIATSVDVDRFGRLFADRLGLPLP